MGNFLLMSHTEQRGLRAATENISCTQNLSPTIYVLMRKFTSYNYNHRAPHFNGLHIFCLHSFTAGSVEQVTYWLLLCYVASYTQLTSDITHEQLTPNKTPEFYWNEVIKKFRTSLLIFTNYQIKIFLIYYNFLKSSLSK